ncbi:MAG TPA: adenosylcobinamide-GDP ribazoletransferase [Terriglobales bacterium]|jgi:adenosylcobinamide-GDP ribazoletransferase|nr:adenosylcobinamide-GDP ribazoletransferase [Terriglobales bacterium]
MRITPVAEQIATAFQFLTRVPLPTFAWSPNGLSRSAKFFPLVGLAIGAVAATLQLWLSRHFPAGIVAILIVLFTALATGGLHEDGLADVADAFGGGHNRDHILAIMKDSHIGSYGAIALTFSIASRILLIAAIPGNKFARYVISAHVLCRWTILPLGLMLPAARKEEGQGARLAKQISFTSLIAGTLIAFSIAAFLLRTAVVGPLFTILLLTLFSGLYYRWRLDGITGDCFGATIQLAEIAVYVCGVWH